MKYNYIVTFWSGNISTVKLDVELVLSSIYYLKDPAIKILLLLTDKDSVEIIRRQFKSYSTFLQCYYVGDIKNEYKISSYAMEASYIERYVSFYKAITELDILSDDHINMVCMIDLTDCYFFKNIFTITNWEYNINLFPDGFTCLYSFYHKIPDPTNMLWINNIDKYLKINKHIFKKEDIILNGGTILCKSFNSFKKLINDLYNIIKTFYLIGTKEPLITDQALLNIYYYNNLYIECVESDFYVYSYYNNFIVGGFYNNKNEDEIFFDSKNFIYKSYVRNYKFSPAIFHAHFWKYPNHIINMLCERINLINRYEI